MAKRKRKIITRATRLDELLTQRQFDLSEDATNTYMSFLIWGAIGSWKTASLATLPPEMLPAYVLDFDNKGLSWLRGKYESEQVRGVSIPTEGKEGWELAGHALDKGFDSSFNTIIVDSGTYAYSCALQYVLNVQGASRQSDDAKEMAADWRRYYNYCHGMFEEFISKLRALPCHVIVTFHETIERDDDEGFILSVHPSIPGKLSERIPGGFSEIYHARAVKISRDETQFVWDTTHRNKYEARSEIQGMPPTIIPSFREVLSIRNGETPSEVPGKKKRAK